MNEFKFNANTYASKNRGNSNCIYSLRPAKTYKLGLSSRSARTPTLETVTGMSAIKMGAVSVAGPSAPLTGPSAPLTGPSVPLADALFCQLLNCRVLIA